MRISQSTASGAGTFIIVMLFIVLAIVVGIVIFFQIKRSRLLNQAPQTVTGRVLQKHPTAMGEEEVLMELEDGSRQRYRMMSGKLVICPGDHGDFEIRGGFVTSFSPRKQV